MIWRKRNKLQTWKLITLLVISLSPLHLLQAQLTTQGGFTAQDLVEDVLLGGGVQVLNVTFQGSNGAIGTFNGASSNIGLSEGVVMTTGSIFTPNGPQGPNNSTQNGFDNGTGGYGLLNGLVGTNTFNATVIRFDFIPQGDTVAFRYVFGSEEYKEYVGTEFNDVFGFFISGPDPSGGTYNNKNIAIIPNTTTPVAINNVNHLSNTAYYVDNESPIPGTTVQYDGFTTVLKAIAPVVPCSTYTIILAIADVADGIYDSGVFLEAKSFSSDGVEVSHTITGSPTNDTLYESCGQAEVTFTWTGDNTNDRTILFNILGTATNGVDYAPIPGSIVIPAGQSSASFIITPTDDGIFEPTESIIIQIIDTDICPNVQLPGDTIFLKNVEPLIVTARPDTVLDCNNEIVTLYASITGGAGWVVYSWDNNVGTGNYIPVLSRQTTTYVVTATDQCGNVESDSVTISVPNVPPLTLSFSPDTAICPGEEVTLTAYATGGIGDITYSWSTGDGNVNSITVSPYETTLYSIAVNDSCGNTLTAKSLVSVRNPSVQFVYSYLENRKLKFTSAASEDVVSYYWNFGDGGTSTDMHPTHEFADTGYFTVTLIVTNAFGCTDTAVQEIYAYPDFVFYIPNTFTPNLDGINDVFSGKGVGFKEYKMRIFDRWGQEIYVTDDYHRGWDGTYKDERCQLGVYAYKIELITPPGKLYTYVGHVNLIR